MTRNGLLDYAANAVVYWPLEEIRARFHRRCEKAQLDPEEVLADFLGPDQAADDFWQRVKTNLPDDHAWPVRILLRLALQKAAVR